MLCISPGHAIAQLDQSDKEIQRYRSMISDPASNPGYLNVDRGEALWSEPRGVKGVSLVGCDLGEGPGKLAGAYAKLPRYFGDAGKVMDVEQRLLWCMDRIQGLDTKEIARGAFSKAGANSDMEDLVAFIANKSNGMKIEPQLSRPEERQAFAIGAALFNRRASISDFSCATCHASDGQRIRLQDLPNFSKPSGSARESFATWPAYRVSQSTLRTLQHRMWDCYRQMRMPPPDYASDGITALILYMAAMAKDGTIEAPSVKR